MRLTDSITASLTPDPRAIKSVYAATKLLFAPMYFVMRSSAHFHCAICAVSKALILSSSLATPGESHIGPSIVFRFSPLPVRRKVRSFTPKCATRTAQLQSYGRYTEGSRVAPKQWLKCHGSSDIVRETMSLFYRR